MSQQVSDLLVHMAARHVPVLRHRNVRVPEVVAANPGRQSFVIDERRDRLAEAAVDRSGDQNGPGTLTSRRFGRSPRH